MKKSILLGAALLCAALVPVTAAHAQSDAQVAAHKQICKQYGATSPEAGKSCFNIINSIPGKNYRANAVEKNCRDNANHCQ